MTLSHEAITATMSSFKHWIPERIVNAAKSGLRDSQDLAWVRERVMQPRGEGFTLLLGGNGTGKTLSAYYASVGFMHTGKFPFTGDMICVGAPEVQQAVLKGSAEHIWSDYKFVIIDDLGAEYESKSDWTASQWDLVFDGLYRRCRETWVTTNLTPEVIRQKYGERIWSRFCDQDKGWQRTFREKQRKG